MSELSEKLLPCPFCGSNKQTIKNVWGNWRFVACECKAGGAPARDDAGAIKNWNTRAEKTCHFIPETMWSYEDEDGNEIDTELMSPFDDYGTASCSVCGMDMMTGDCGWFNEEEQPNGGIKLIPKFKYCPYCGAKVVKDGQTSEV